jgi:hypothetical protein
LATGLAQEVQLNPVDGNHTNVPLPLGIMVVFPPLQIVRSGPALTEGKAGYVILIASVAVPQLLVTVSVYVTTAVGVETGLGHVVQLKVPSLGDHRYVPLPVPFRVVLSPAQTETSGPALAVGRGFTVML